MSKAIQIGEQAKRILEDTMVVDAFIDVEKAIHSAWADSESAEVRDKLWYTLEGLKRFKQYFTMALDDGEFEKQIQQDHSKKRNFIVG